jgi:ATP synthase I subunit
MVYTPVSAAANLRRSALVSVALGVAALAVTAVLGYPLMGMFGCIGLGLGAYNNRLLQQSVLRFAANSETTKKEFRRGVMGRLGAITLIAIACGVVVRPDGLGVFVGLAVFQVLMLIGSAVPVFRSLRPSH